MACAFQGCGSYICFVSIPVVGIRCSPSLNPFNSRPLISHLTNSNGCGNLLPKVLLTCPRVVPPSTLQETCLPTLLLANRPNFCASSANSCCSIICALFNSLAALFRTRALCFQQFAHSFAKMPGVWGGHPERNDGMTRDRRRILGGACKSL